ncbi:SDR family NAD(P)-dependent oxidoreductase [Tepidamorphus sp. 3E244]|uniref:SDR family NAD(P)-dependent oxidoreductase n=1 Tax=Tepidamorphus sp. 3E244 TaxID=3385498 RepID=UPI0038FC09CE
MDLGLTGKVAIVTGGSRGIGLATASRLAGEGASVTICGRDADALDAACEQLGLRGCPVLPFKADMADARDRQELVDAVLAEYGRIDILVNNAGTHVRANLDDMTEDQLQHHLDVKLFGSLGMIRAVLPAMRNQGGGAIVNVVGQAARHPHPDRLPSGITNAAVMAMSKSVADGVARDNIRVNTVCPQYIATELVDSIIENEMKKRGVSREVAASGFTRANPMGRLGTPEEIADAVAFLVSDCAGYVAGSSVSVDGGYHRYVFG